MYVDNGDEVGPELAAVVVLCRRSPLLPWHAWLATVL